MSLCTNDVFPAHHEEQFGQAPQEALQNPRLNRNFEDVQREGNTPDLEGCSVLS